MEESLLDKVRKYMLFEFPYLVNLDKGGDYTHIDQRIQEMSNIELLDAIYWAFK
jgi:hypothetical protein